MNFSATAGPCRALGLTAASESLLLAHGGSRVFYPAGPTQQLTGTPSFKIRADRSWRVADVAEAQSVRTCDLQSEAGVAGATAGVATSAMGGKRTIETFILLVEFSKTTRLRCRHSKCEMPGHAR